MADKNKRTALLEDPTTKLMQWASDITEDDISEFEKAKKISRWLGAHYDNGKTTIGFWTPELRDDDEIFLEIYFPLEEVRFRVDEQQIHFYYERVPIKKQGEYCWGVYEGLKAGNGEDFGCFYQLGYRRNAEVTYIADPMAYSLPFGAFAPAELFDVNSAQKGRRDKEYFADLHTDSESDIPRINAATNMLEIHVGTASKRGTFKGLTDIYRSIAIKIKNGESLSPQEEVYAGYDGIQLMPIEPVIESPREKPFWKVVNAMESDQGDLAVLVRHPNMINWGYDILIFGSCAINSTMLETGRPNEFIEFLEVMHNFPGKPIKVTIDIVFGHSDNQGKLLLNDQFFKGDNMYGQDIDYRHPVVRAILMEMQRRKMNWGIDAIRIDGAQDFKYYDEEQDELIHDDDFLKGMSFIEQNVGGYSYYPWMIFEDGRPWPRENWELASTYRHLIEQQDFAYQWGPLIFAHNTPFLYTYWATKWWRVQEMAQMGDRWISGYANHDTLRRGIQSSPQKERINTQLGDSYKEIIDRAYDNPATTLLCNNFLPGVPMDFLNSSFHAPWSFMRNTDTRWALKVVAEERNFLHWQVSDFEYKDPKKFRRLKNYGFNNLSQLKEFMRMVDHYIEATAYNIDLIAELLNTTYGQNRDITFNEGKLIEFAQAWMRDIYEFCNVHRYEFILDHNQTTFNLKSRKFRQKRPWLQQSLSDDDVFDFRRPANGTVLYYGMRISPDGDETLLFMANMEGEPITITAVDLPIPNLPQDRWKKELAAPKTPVQSALKPFELEQAKGVIFSRSEK